MRKNLFYSVSLILFLSFLGLMVSTVVYAVLMNKTAFGEINALRISVLSQQLFVFAIPAVIAGKLVFGEVATSLRITKTDGKGVLLSVIMMVVAIPFIDVLAKLNEGLHLPQSLHSLEEWIRTTETKSMAITEQLLATTTLGGLFANIGIVALITAISEELFFRGLVQRLLEERTSQHIAIWVTAVIFSAIHFQFLGFVPRLILGAMFGYLAVWSGSLLLPVIAHFVNNAIGVIAYYLNHNKILEIPTENFAISTGLISLVVFATVFFLINKYYSKKWLQKL